MAATAGEHLVVPGGVSGLPAVRPASSARRGPPWCRRRRSTGRAGDLLPLLGIRNDRREGFPRGGEPGPREMVVNEFQVASVRHAAHVLRLRNLIQKSRSARPRPI